MTDPQAVHEPVDGMVHASCGRQLFAERGAHGVKWLCVHCDAVVLVRCDEGQLDLGIVHKRVVDHRVDPWPRALRIRACLCGHDEIDHSRVLPGSPCLDCDCPAMMHASEHGLSTFTELPQPGEPSMNLLDPGVRWRRARANPSRSTRW